MKLQYRGNSYEHNPQLIETPESKTTAKYWSKIYRIKQSVNPTVPDSIVNLKYRTEWLEAFERTKQLFEKTFGPGAMGYSTPAACDILLGFN